MKSMTAMLCLDRGDCCRDGLEVAYRRLFGGGQFVLGPEMLYQYEQRLFDAAQLLPVTRDIGDNFFLDRRLRGLSQFNVYQPDLTADRVERPGPRVDRLRDIAGKRKPKDGHRVVPPQADRLASPQAAAQIATVSIGGP